MPAVLQQGPHRLKGRSPKHCTACAQAQHEAETTPPAVAARRALRAQRGFCALAGRALILHGGKLVALAAFGAAMQAPSAAGWLLTRA